MVFINLVRCLVPNLFCFALFPLFIILSKIIGHKSTWISRFVDIFIYNASYLLSNAFCLYPEHIIISTKICIALNVHNWNSKIISFTSDYDYVTLHVHEIGKYNFGIKEGQLSILSKKYKTEKTQFSPE